MNNEQYRAQYASKTFPLCSDRLSRFSRRLRKRRPFDVTAGEGQKCRPVRAGGVTPAMLAPGQLAIYERSIHGWKFSRPVVLIDYTFVQRHDSDGAPETLRFETQLA